MKGIVFALKLLVGKLINRYSVDDRQVKGQPQIYLRYIKKGNFPVYPVMEKFN